MPKLILALIFTVTLAAFGALADDDPRIANSKCPHGGKHADVRLPDMKLWDAVLKAHVKKGIVDYRAIEKDKRFAQFLNQWDCVNLPAVERLKPNERAAFWGNIYNAIVVANVLKHYPISTTDQVENFYALRVAHLGGHLASSNECYEKAVQHPDPRAAFTLCLGLMGSPPLRSEAYTSARYEEQMEDQARNFVRNPKNFRIERRGNYMVISEIFRMNQMRIGKKHKTIFAFIAQYLASEEDAKMVTSGRLTYRFEMDSDLNGEGAY